MKELLEILKGWFNKSKSVRFATKLRAETITQNTRLNDTKYGGWLAVNIGTSALKVYGVELQPGEGLSSESICHLEPGDLWQEPIEITDVQASGAVRLLRSINTPIR